MRPLTRSLGAVALMAAISALGVAAGTRTSETAAAAPVGPSETCTLGQNGKVKHVIYVQFDNTHFRRDNPNVPSDLEQMPNLLSFLRKQGTLLTNDHTVLISHTGGGILSTITGLYPDRHGQPVSNAYGFFRPDKSVGFSTSFKYWTDQTDASTPSTDPNPNMVNNDPPSLGGTGAARMTPAPWVTFTRAGCDVGAAGIANTVLENTGTDPTGDMTKVFGVGSPEWNEAQAAQGSADPAVRAQPQTDFVGMAIHCAVGGGICNANTANARPDQLPEEAGGYTGFKALFGAKYVNPAITKSAANPNGAASVDDTSGQPVTDPFGQPGFPGFDGMLAKNTLGYVAQMQEAGVPVTFAYISDAHDFHGVSGNAHRAFGPGEAGYVQQLRDYDKAFGDFFARLGRDGITSQNTLFVFTVEEGDHFAGTAPDAPCDGVTTPCTYANGHVTEVNGDVKKMVATYNATHAGNNATTDFSVHTDMAPNVYITGDPARDSAAARTLERTMSDIKVKNPLSGVTQPLFVAMADPVEEKLLHMVTADPARTPTFTPFAQGDYFLNASSTTPCTGNNLDNCVFLPNTAPPASTFAWNHGGVQPEIANTWAGIVGPGVKGGGQDDTLFTDHTDVRPTMLSLLGLKDSYVSDGRVLTDLIVPGSLPKALKAPIVQDLGHAYKQIMASFGRLSADSLVASTRALASSAPGDTGYTTTEDALQKLTSDRDALAAKIRLALWNAEFNGQAVDPGLAQTWIDQANELLDRAQALASG